MRRAMILAYVAMSIAAACRSYSGADPGTDGGDIVRDGGGDEERVDGTVPPGTDGDVPPAADGAVTSCEGVASDPNVILCDDFDGPDAGALSGWLVGGGGTFTLAPGKVGQGLSMATQVRDGGGPSIGRYDAFDPQTTHVELDFDFLVVSAALDYGTFGAVRLAGQSYGNAWGIGIYSGTLLSKAYSASTTIKLQGGWHHATVTVAASQSVTIDGTSFDSRADSLSGADHSTLNVGIFDVVSQSGASVNVVFDNVVLRKIP